MHLFMMSKLICWIFCRRWPWRSMKRYWKRRGEQFWHWKQRRGKLRWTRNCSPCKFFLSRRTMMRFSSSWSVSFLFFYLLSFALAVICLNILCIFPFFYKGADKESKKKESAEEKAKKVFTISLSFFQSLCSTKEYKINRNCNCGHLNPIL